MAAIGICRFPQLRMGIEGSLVLSPGLGAGPRKAVLGRWGPQRAVSYIQFYGKLSVKNPASRGQVNLDAFNYGVGILGCQGVWDGISVN